MEFLFMTPIADSKKNSDPKIQKSKKMSLSCHLPTVRDNKESELSSKILPSVFGTLLTISNSKRSSRLHPHVNSTKPTFGIWSIFKPGSPAIKPEWFTFGTYKNKFLKEKFSASTEVRSMTCVRFLALIFWQSPRNVELTG